MKKGKKTEASNLLVIVDPIPDDVWALILSRMPIRDAVRTSVLSKAWHRRWRSTSALIFDEWTIPRRRDGPPSPYYLQLGGNYVPVRQGRAVHQWLVTNLEVVEWLAAADILRRVMQQQESPILIFRLTSRLGDAFPLGEALKPWVGKHCETLEELVLDGCPLYLPAELYAGSGGFPKLTVLALKDVMIKADDLSGLISSCPLLSQLKLDIKDLKRSPAATDTESSYPTLVVSAARLRHLEMRLGGLIWCISLIAPQLVSAWISLAIFNGVHLHTPLPHGCNLIHLLSDSPRLEKLTITSMSLQFLCVDKIPSSLRQPLSQLQRLDLKINIESPFHARGALCLFRSSPNLMRLRIDCWSSGSGIPHSSTYPDEAANIWAAAATDSCYFPCLKHLLITQLNGIDCEVAFLRFVLQQAPALAELDVKARSGIDEITGPLDGLKDMLASRRGTIRATVHCCRSHVNMS